MQTRIFKALSELTRLRCVMLLAQRKELCVCDLTNALELPQPKVSHHLGYLRRAGLVCDRKQGLWHFYSLHPELPGWVYEIINDARNGLASQAPFADDIIRLNNPEATTCCA